jgi:hypothetical protein
MVKEARALPLNSLCSLGGSFGATVKVGDKVDEQVRRISGREFALAELKRRSRNAKPITWFMAGLTPELSRAAKRRRLE